MPKKKSELLPAEVQLLKDLPEPKPLYCTRLGVERLFGIKVSTLSNMAVKKIGPKYWRRGKMTFYRVSDVEAWVTENPVETTGGNNHE